MQRFEPSNVVASLFRPPCTPQCHSQTQTHAHLCTSLMVPMYTHVYTSHTPVHLTHPCTCHIHEDTLGTLSCSLMPHIHLTILISACLSATSFSFLMGQVSLPCNISLRTHLLYKLPLTINDISLSVSNGTNRLNLFYPI